MPPRSVLVTGASTGIGEATALRLSARGWTVFAGAIVSYGSQRSPDV